MTGESSPGEMQTSKSERKLDLATIPPFALLDEDVFTAIRMCS
jgi:hypothetical protein